MGTTYIENCEEIVQTHCEEQHTQVHHGPRLLVMILTRFMEVTPMVITREMLKLVTKVTHLDLTARTMCNTSVTRFLSNMRERFQERSARPLLILPTLRSARISSMSSVMRLMFRLTIAPRLLVMTPMLLTTIPMDMDMAINLFHKYLISSFVE